MITGHWIKSRISATDLATPLFITCLSISIRGRQDGVGCGSDRESQEGKDGANEHLISSIS